MQVGKEVIEAKYASFYSADIEKPIDNVGKKGNEGYVYTRIEETGQYAKLKANDFMDAAQANNHVSNYTAISYSMNQLKMNDTETQKQINKESCYTSVVDTHSSISNSSNDSRNQSQRYVNLNSQAGIQNISHSMKDSNYTSVVDYSHTPTKSSASNGYDAAHTLESAYVSINEAVTKTVSHVPVLKAESSYISVAAAVGGHLDDRSVYTSDLGLKSSSPNFYETYQNKDSNYLSLNETNSVKSNENSGTSIDIVNHSNFINGDREVAERNLRKDPLLRYILRPCTSAFIGNSKKLDPNVFVVTFISKDKLKNYKIFRKETYLTLEGDCKEKFSSIASIVDKIFKINS